jgi:hypothetical protein
MKGWAMKTEIFIQKSFACVFFFADFKSTHLSLPPVCDIFANVVDG